MIPLSHATFISELVDLVNNNKESGKQLFVGTGAKPAIAYPPLFTAQWEEQVHVNHIFVIFGQIFYEIC